MPRISYVNGRYIPHDEAVVHIEDRGYQFADAVYEVVPILHGRLLHLEQHLDRLGRSLAALEIAPPASRRVLPVIMAQVVQRNRIQQGLVYLQISRGSAPRNHLHPKDMVSTLVVTAMKNLGVSDETVARGIAVISQPDIRWLLPQIKSVALLPNAMAKQQAVKHGAADAWLIRDNGLVTEATAANAFILRQDGVLQTHPDDGGILPGVTRLNVLDLARQMGLTVEEKPFTLKDAKAAREAFQTGTTVMVLPVTKIDDTPILDGKPGPVSLELRRRYLELRA